ncbi:MAG: nucleotidyl transferase AbiEii/AbiGii toxin family protein [Prevotellaceae bacterium]|jgi:hypothetical protein|nr:nucleotidyl transferase AbiEii/AbiGii toxin family protein [Prevotellaceae bacterium]
MLYTQAVESHTLGLLEKLSADNALNGFLLAGGTNLALRLGHRKSIDLDFFAYQHFDAISLSDYLIEKYNFKKQDVRVKDTIKGSIDNVKVDIIAHVYPLVDEPLLTNQGFRLYGLKDIVAMKLAAISDSGRRIKDFVDIAYLSTHFSFAQMLDTYAEKYINSSVLHAARGLVFFEDIDFDVPIDLMGNRCFEWINFKKRIYEMVQHENKIFEYDP